MERLAPRLLLDTNAVISLLNHSSKDLDRRIRREIAGTVAISAIVLHELFYGAYKSARTSANVALIDSLQFRH